VFLLYRTRIETVSIYRKSDDMFQNPKSGCHYLKLGFDPLILKLFAINAMLLSGFQVLNAKSNI